MPKEVKDNYARRILQKYRLHPNFWGYRQDNLTQVVDGVPSVTPAPDAPLDITDASPLPDCVVGVAYGPLNLTVTGGTGPYVWTLVSGALPDGLSISAAGQIAGTPTTEGTATFSVRVTDSKFAGKQKTFTIGTGTLTITTASLPDASFGFPYAQAINVIGGTQPYYWYLSSGDLPIGLALDTSGNITGTPSVIPSGTFFFSIVVQDAVAGYDQVDLSITVV